jgi:amino acid transporter
MLSNIRRYLIGNPLPTEQTTQERLGKTQALAILSSDALSSVAYATEEILLVLVLAGTSALSLALPIAFAIAFLLVIVVSSYYQTVDAYPTGGGAYTVAKENLGIVPGLIAGASLLIGYVLTVAVSISAGVAAITSAFPLLLSYRVELALLTIFIVTIINLRGVRESGRVFALPTYFFIISMLLLIIVGIGRTLWGGLVIAKDLPASTIITSNVTLFFILRAFASGCTALTGVEAISNGVPIFKKPEADNARKTLLWMAAILITLFLGITFLARLLEVTPSTTQTTLSQLAHVTFGEGVIYYVVQAITAIILLLAANTSYAGFPRLAKLIAEDEFLPRQLSHLGDRLVYANGITLLGLISAVLVIIFQADTHALIPLYAVGVFISFTLSQSGMVVHWLQTRTHGWRRSVTINGIGALTTGVVSIVMTVTKFIYGAWIAFLLITALIYIFYSIHHHYRQVKGQLSLTEKWPSPIRRHTVIVPIANLHRGVVKAVQYAQIIGGDLQIVTVEINQEESHELQAKWRNNFPEIELHVLPSPYRSVITPLIGYIDQFVQEEGDYVTIIVPEFVPARWWHNLLHNQTALALKVAILYSRKSWKSRFHIMTDVPFYLNA